MRISTFIVLFCVFALIAIFGIRSAPYIRGKIEMRTMQRKLDVAMQSARRLATQLGDDPRFKNVRFYAWPMEGVVIKFEGSVYQSNDIVELKKIVEAANIETPARWYVTVTNVPDE